MSHVHALQRQQFCLSVYAAAVSGKIAAGAHHTMAWDHQGNRVVPHGAAHCLGRHPLHSLPPGRLRSNLSVGHDLPIGNGQHNVADALAKRRGVIAHGRQEVRLPPGEVNIQPALCLPEQRMLSPLGLRGQDISVVSLPIEPQADDSVLIAGQGDRAQGGRIFGGISHYVFSLSAPARCR